MNGLTEKARAALVAASRKAAGAVIRRHFYPDRGGYPIRHDPTYGRIDRDIQWRVQRIAPSSLGQRVAMENTLQRDRDARHSFHRFTQEERHHA